MRPAYRVAAVASAAALSGSLLAFRRHLLRWGATDDEVAAALPGDELVPDPSFSATRAITIAAPPADVWPWIVQMGYGRAGFYAYDWLDNLGHGRSADEIVPDLQRLEV
jgi:hypothetical protein